MQTSRPPYSADWQTHYTLIPEPFTLNRETGAKEEGSKIEGTGYGEQDGAAASR
ncbi:hypothetical protein N9262_03785 [Akkermansiaceae bacterium]|nr:hypothetical protein [Akkermansiaceae bacterium]